MKVLGIIIMGIALGTDAFSVALALGVKKYNWYQIVKLSLTVGIFHIFMPLLGIYGGNFIKNYISHFHLPGENLNYTLNLIASLLLILVGIYIIIENYYESEEKLQKIELTWPGLIILSISVSLDALTAGISLGILSFALISVVIFGIIAVCMVVSGLYLGTKIGHWLGEDAQILGGIVIVIMGIYFSGVV